jgi:ferrous iron transport protein B
VGTMSTLYSVGSDDEKKLSEKLALQKRADGSPMYTPGVSMALLLFYVFALQCMSTMAVVKKETESWKIPLIQFIFMGTLAYLSAWLAYTLI